MGSETSLFTMALGLQAPWSVADVRFDAKAKEIHFEVRFQSGTRFACPSCGAPDQPVHDTRLRNWEHLRFFEHKAFINASVPRVASTQCGKTRQVPVPWASSGSGFSQLFDAFVIAMAREMPVKAIADLLEVGDDRIWCVLDHYVPAARELKDFSDVTAERACPLRIRTILTDNGKEFTDRLFDLRKRAATGKHEFDTLCTELGIDHRLTPPQSPQKNGMVERFNERIEDVLQSHHFRSEEDLNATMHRYVLLYNQQLPQSVLQSRTPLQAMKDWHKLKPEMFKKNPYYLTGCDN